MRQRIQGVQIGFYFGFIGISLLGLFFWQKDSFLNRAETAFLAAEAWPAVTNLESDLGPKTDLGLKTWILVSGFEKWNGFWKSEKGFEKVKRLKNILGFEFFL